MTEYLINKPELLNDMQEIMKKVGYWDPGIKDNIKVTLNDQIAFIDTEPYPDDHNFIVQPILNLLFFRLQKRGDVATQKLKLLVEQAKNPHLYKKQSSLKVVGKYAVCALAIYGAIKVAQKSY